MLMLLKYVKIESYHCTRQFNQSQLLKAVDLYKKNYGTSLIPVKFIIPNDSQEWPIEMQRQELGKHVSRIRTLYKRGELSSDFVKRLDNLKFVWDVKDYRWKKRIFPALETYRKLYDHLRVPYTFVVPSNEKWQKETHNLALGKTVSKIRSQGDFIQNNANRKKQLDDIGFVWSSWDDRFETIVYSALVAFKEQYHHLFVGQDFVVPSIHPWPKVTWNLKLGAYVEMIRVSPTYAPRHSKRWLLLQEIGFVWRHYQDKFTQLVYPALVHYKEIHKDLHILRDFVVPSEDSWPKHLWGLKLGFILHNIKSRGYYNVGDMDEREKLLELGVINHDNNKIHEIRGKNL